MKKLKLKDVVVAIVFVFLCILSVKFFGFNDTDYIITVTDKDRITQFSKNGSISKYLIFADGENGNPLVFENTDCLIRLKFNSSDLQGQLKEGHTYKITVIGYRVPIFSWYQNIIKVEETSIE